MDDDRLKYIMESMLRHGLVKFGEFTLTSGIKSAYYIDLRPVPSIPRLFRLIVEGLLEISPVDECDGFVGIATGGIPLACYMAVLTNKPMAYVRRERKEHGEMKIVEGFVKNLRVIIVDDVATTGSSIASAINVIRSEGGEPILAVVVVDREQGARSRIEGMGVPFKSLMKASTILNYTKCFNTHC